MGLSLASGTRIGPYEIVGPLGAGGMGEVYRARDARLNRDVALKVLPEVFARDPERMARFHREAQVLASLNHPNIAALYGFLDSGRWQRLARTARRDRRTCDFLAGSPHGNATAFLQRATSGKSDT